MITTVIKPPMRMTAIIRGDVGAARDATALYVGPDRPIRNPHYNATLDLTWVTVWADPEQMNAWMADAAGEPGNRPPGTLTFWIGHNGLPGIQQ